MSSHAQDGAAQCGLWLHPGFGPVTLKTLGGLVSVAESAYHGSVSVVYDANMKADVMSLAFCGSGREVLDFQNQVPHRLLEIAEGVFRNHNMMQIYVVGDVVPRYRAIKEALSWKTNLCTGSLSFPDCSVLQRGLYLHPGAEAASIQLTYVAGMPKISWKGGTPNGHWEVHPVPRHWGASHLNTDEPVLSLRFNARGIEEDRPKPATIYAVLKGSSNVYRAVGQAIPGDGGVKLYADHELVVLKTWHIVIVFN